MKKLIACLLPLALAVNLANGQAPNPTPAEATPAPVVGTNPATVDVDVQLGRSAPQPIIVRPTQDPPPPPDLPPEWEDQIKARLWFHAHYKRRGLIFKRYLPRRVDDPAVQNFYMIRSYINWRRAGMYGY